MGILDTLKGKKGAAAKAAKPKAAMKKTAAPKKSAEPKEAAKTDAAATSRTGGSLAASIILERPVFTEKVEAMAASGKYAFYVSTSANKTEVARAVKAVYGVTPTSVRMIVVKGKPVRFGRSAGYRKDRKKAIVTLKPGEKITVMQGA